jgi:hypothetical protein
MTRLHSLIYYVANRLVIYDIIILYKYIFIINKDLIYL